MFEKTENFRKNVKNLTKKTFNVFWGLERLKHFCAQYCDNKLTNKQQNMF